MQFNIQETISRESKLTIDEQLNVDALFEGRQDVLSAGPLHVSLQVWGMSDHVAAEGQLTVDLEMACSRCLESVKEHIVIPFYEGFKYKATGKTEEESEAESEDYIVVSEERVDLKPYVEEYLLLFMPFAPLCSQDCSGLCPKCGSNLNEQPCGCDTRAVDPRFAALKDLFKE
ncbi:YceD family protein [Paenibacillus sp. GCM10023252]|uniref:YceD family protein n=1 Tax=Paenibacillus sp. GCM10023252 TaxID=3252649 RepID=UPI0036244711